MNFAGIIIKIGFVILGALIFGLIAKGCEVEWEKWKIRQKNDHG